jgi:hypothetical protein
MTGRRRGKPTYNSSVFINCPFDFEYRPLFRALVFTIEACGFAPRRALEVEDSGETRAEKLVRLIRGSRLGIHDISRTELNPEGLPRFNMPYEFGMFVGLKHSTESVQRRKAVLVLDREPYRYQRFLSDIAGQDIQSHGGRVEQLIAKVRNWLRNQTTADLFGSVAVIEMFGEFLRDMPESLAELNKTEADLDNYRDFHALVFHWIAYRRSQPDRPAN